MASLLQLGEGVELEPGISLPGGREDDPAGVAAWRDITLAAKASERAASLDSAIEYCVFRQDADGVTRAA